MIALIVMGTWASQFASTQKAREGQLDEAVAMLNQAIASLKAIPDFHVLVEALGRLGDCYLRKGELDKVFASIEEAERWITKQRVSGQATACSRLAKAWAYLAHAELSDERAMAASLRAGERTCRSALRAGKIFVCIVPQAVCILGSLNWIRGHNTVAHRFWRRSLQTAEQLGAPYDLALTHREIGRLARDEPELETALKLFRETGATFDAARTMRHLGEVALSRDPQSSSAWFDSALQLHRSMAADYELALTHRGYGRVCAALGQEEEARRHLTRAVELLGRTGDTATIGQLETEREA